MEFQLLFFSSSVRINKDERFVVHFFRSNRMSWKINENSYSSTTIDEIREKRRSNLSQRIRKARLQLDSLTNLQSSYSTTRDHLIRWRSKMIEEIHQAHQTSTDELNQTFEQCQRLRSHPDGYLWKNAEFSFDFHPVNQLDGQLELLKLSNSSSKSSTKSSTIQCRLLIRRDRFDIHWPFYENLVQRIDGQTSIESILICPLEILDEIIQDENEIRILIDQSYLTAIRSQMSRMSKDFDLVQLQSAQESCPQSTERVIKIIGHDSKKVFDCLKEIYSICSQCEKPSQSILYNPINSNRSKVHLYGGYSDLSTTNSIDSTKLFPQSNRQCESPVMTNSTSNNHFDRVLMPVSIRETVRITDMQAGALLGPKGERIQQLQRETGAIVTIGDVNDEPIVDRRKRIVFIQGNQQQVNEALRSIRKLLNRSDEDLNEESNNNNRYRKS